MLDMKRQREIIAYDESNDEGLLFICDQETAKHLMALSDNLEKLLQYCHLSKMEGE